MTELHAHHCPECYEHVPCSLACTLEPDLGTTEVIYPPTGRKILVQFGAHTMCEACRYRNQMLADSHALRQIYDGFKRSPKYILDVTYWRYELDRSRAKPKK